MNDEELKQIIDEAVSEAVNAAVNKTVLKLKMSGLMRDDRKTAYQKTEELLRNYNDFCTSDQPYTKKLVAKIDEALEEISGDSYGEIISLIYFEGESRESVAEYYNTTVTTISRNKTRLVNRLKVILFSDDVIYELFL